MTTGVQRLVTLLLALFAGLQLPAVPATADTFALTRFREVLDLQALVPGAERLGPLREDPPRAAALAGGQVIGFVFVNSDVTDSHGYSARPIHVAVGMRRDGTILGTQLLEHHEPIVLIGIPEARISEVLAHYTGRNFLQTATPDGAGTQHVDAVSGATVTVLVIDDSIRRAVRRVGTALGDGPVAPRQIRRRAGPGAVPGAAPGDNWAALLESGAIANLELTRGEVNAAFERQGGPGGGRPEPGDPQARFIDLYTAPVSLSSLGKALLGEREFTHLRERLDAGQHAIVVAARGPYSWRGSGYVRGGIFDRIALMQAGELVRFRDSDYKRIGRLAADGAPTLPEIGVFAVPADTVFDPLQPWRLQLVVQRAVGALEKDFLAFELPWMPPPDASGEPVSAGEDAAGASQVVVGEQAPLWQRIWRARLLEVVILLLALGLLAVLFMFQDWFARRPRLLGGVRIGFLLFTLLWLGWYANAQLSVVNVLTFSNAFMGEFRWSFFLMDPMLFILWSATAVAILFWGRGAYCGWLCPFGALQELLNRAARRVGIPQLRLPWGLHERLWPLKYVLFLALFGLSLHSLAQAERAAEIEPFKTAITLKFLREWQFVGYAAVLLGIGLFIERFFCRYLCPLGAALAIPGRIRMFEWLRRYPECGKPCQRCRHECMVQAIHPEGHINPNECVYCLHCQQVYHDEHACPVMIQKRLRRERREARATGAGPAIPTARTDWPMQGPPG